MAPKEATAHLTRRQMNGIWLLVLLGRWTMVAGWIAFFGHWGGNRAKNPLVAVEPRGESGSAV